jgi:hypothetical protein
VTFIAAAALAAMTVMVGLTLIARALPARSHGLHRAPRQLLRPIEALDQFEARCPIERRRTLHVRFALGGVQCLDCRRDFTNTEHRQGDQ